MEDLLTPDAGFALGERAVGVKDVGASPRHMKDIVLAVVRNGQLLRVDAPEADAVELGDKLLVIKTAAGED
jgi:voltage-gated potassium channel